MEIKGDEAIIVAIDKDKTSQHALKWAVDHVLMKGRIITLVHVKQRQPATPTLVGNAMLFSDINDDVGKKNNQAEGREIFLPFRCFLTRKDIKCEEVLLEGVDISRTLIEYATTNAIEVMILGASSKNGFLRKFKGSDVATNVTKGAPDYCSVYVIQKGKMLSVRSATRSVPPKTSGGGGCRNQTPTRTISNDASPGYSPAGPAVNKGDKWPCTPTRPSEESDEIRSPFIRGRAANGRSYGGVSMPDSDISFVSSRPSTERSSIDRCSFDIIEFTQAPRLSSGSDMTSVSSFSERRSIDLNSLTDYSSSSGNGFPVSLSMHVEDVETEMKRLRLELQQTMQMYNAACKEALTAKQKAIDLQISKTEETQRIEAARSAEEAAMAIAEQEKAKCRAAMEAAEAAQRLAELEARKRLNVEMKAHNETDEKTKAITVAPRNDVRYRRYSIEEIEIATEYFSESLKIGEGGYGPVYHCTLDHTSVAIKVLRPDAAQGQSQFQQEVEILCTIRHPHMVLLLGACPEYGCLVYEYMSNGSLEDRLFRRENSPPLPWQLRFRIAAEIATALNFLHHSKPEPLVHRDLKPANILIDRNYVSKISDVGLARLVPPTMADNVTQYRMTQAAGTFFYIDPEYQQTGMLGTKSDIYSLGILYLQLITARPAMGLTHHVQRALENGTFREMLDPTVPDWPYAEALEFATISLACSELRRKDRPDLTQILPALSRLSEFGESQMSAFMFTPPAQSRQSQVSTAQILQEVISENPSTTSATSSG